MIHYIEEKQVNLQAKVIASMDVQIQSKVTKTT